MGFAGLRRACDLRFFARAILGSAPFSVLLGGLRDYQFACRPFEILWVDHGETKALPEFLARCFGARLPVFRVCARLLAFVVDR